MIRFRGCPEIFVTAGMLTNASIRISVVSSGGRWWRNPPCEARQRNTRAAGAHEPVHTAGYSWNGHERNVLYVRRNGRYEDCSGISGIDFADDSRSFAVTDFDGDGNLDILLKSRLGPQVRALQNHCAAGKPAVAISLQGTKSNRDAIGARVEINGCARSIRAGSGFLFSQHTKSLISCLAAIWLQPVCRLRNDSAALVCGPRRLFSRISGFPSPSKSVTANARVSSAKSMPQRRKSPDSGLPPYIEDIRLVSAPAIVLPDQLIDRVPAVLVIR